VVALLQQLFSEGSKVRQAEPQTAPRQLASVTLLVVQPDSSCEMQAE
jgi:hypothetical protein